MNKTIPNKKKILKSITEYTYAKVPVGFARLTNTTYPNLLTHIQNKLGIKCKLEHIESASNIIKSEIIQCQKNIFNGKFSNLKAFWGCVKNGFSRGCKNCISLPKALAITGQKGSASDFMRQVISKTNGKIHWNNKTAFNSNFIEHLQDSTRTHANWMIPYFGDASLMKPSEILSIILQAFKFHRQNFVFTTKRPDILLPKVKIVINMLSKNGYNIYKLHNLYFATSVEDNASLWRIDALRKFYGFKLIVFFKPLLEAIIKPNLKNIFMIRVAAEKKGRYGKPRECEKKWILDLMLEGMRQNVNTFFDKE